MSAIRTTNPSPNAALRRKPRPSAADLVGRRRWLTSFFVSKSREGWLWFWNTSGNDPPACNRA